MAQILVRGLDARVVERLKERARSEGHSLQSAVKRIIEQAGQASMESARKRASAIRHQLAGRKFCDSARLIREDRMR